MHQLRKDFQLWCEMDRPFLQSKTQDKTLQIIRFVGKGKVIGLRGNGEVYIYLKC